MWDFYLFAMIFDFFANLFGWAFSEDVKWQAYFALMCFMILLCVTIGIVVWLLVKS